MRKPKATTEPWPQTEREIDRAFKRADRWAASPPESQADVISKKCPAAKDRANLKDENIGTCTRAPSSAQP